MANTLKDYLSEEATEIYFNGDSARAGWFMDDVKDAVLELVIGDKYPKSKLVVHLATSWNTDILLIDCFISHTAVFLTDSHMKSADEVMLSGFNDWAIFKVDNSRVEIGSLMVSYQTKEKRMRVRWVGDRKPYTPEAPPKAVMR